MPRKLTPDELHRLRNRQVADLALLVADDIFSPQRIWQIVGEDLQDYVTAMVTNLHPNTVKNHEKYEQVYEVILNALPTKELETALDQLCDLNTDRVGNAELSHLLIGLVCGMKLAGATRSRIREVCENWDWGERAPVTI